MTIEAPRQTFWSRRRDAVRAEADAEAAALAAAEAVAERVEAERRHAERSDDEILDDLGLKDPDLMKMGDDFSAFMDKAVPERLRRRALRTLWRSNPVLANLDGLVDFGEDFTDAAMVVPDMKTAYQVGRGMMRHVTALAEAAEAEQARAELAARDAGVETDPEPAAALAPEPMVPSAAAVDDTEAPCAPDDPVDPAAFDLPRPRHMRFSFAD